MRLLFILLAVTALFDGDDPEKKGREGNILYSAGELTAAADAYRAGIAAIQAEGPGTVHAGLLNNLGAALYRQGDFAGAASSFSSSTHMSPDADARVRAFYNAGNALTKAEELESALEMYRQALLQDPSNEDAKFNYEYVKRQLQDQQQQNEDQNQDDQEQQENEGDGDENQDQTDEQNQDQQQQQQDPENADQQNQDQQQQQQQQQQDPTKMSPAEAQRILEALENEEEQLLRQVQKMNTRPRRVEKDW